MENEKRCDFVVKPNVGDHCKGFKSKKVGYGKREKGPQNREFARRCFLNALIFDPQTTKNVDFCGKTNKDVTF